jgi:hypothetical protein
MDKQFMPVWCVRILFEYVTPIFENDLISRFLRFVRIFCLAEEKRLQKENLSLFALTLCRHKFSKIGVRYIVLCEGHRWVMPSPINHSIPLGELGTNMQNAMMKKVMGCRKSILIGGPLFIKKCKNGIKA